jgi:hypothetical protein
MELPALEIQNPDIFGAMQRGLQAGQQQRLQSSRLQAGGLAASGDLAGAQSTALRSGDLQFASQISQLSAQQRDALRQRYQQIGSLSLQALQEKDPAQQKNALVYIVGHSEELGVPRDEIQKSLQGVDTNDPKQVTMLLQRLSSNAASFENTLSMVHSQAQMDLAKSQFERQSKQTDALIEHYKAEDSRAGAGNANVQSVIQTAGGAYGVLRDGSLKKLTDEAGKPLIGYQADVGLKGDIKKAQEIGTESGKTTFALPMIEQQTNMALGTVDSILNDPAKKDRVGFLGVTPAIPGTPGAGFDLKIDQLKGEAFLSAYNSLRGGGAITDIEGKKATEALVRAGQAQKVSDFDTAMNEYKKILKTGLERARKQASMRGTGQTSAPDTAPQPAQGTAPAPGGVLKYDAQGNRVQQ